MIPLAVVLALALAAGPSGPPRRTAQDVSNAARAKAGLLPRKVARTRVVVTGGHRLVRAPAPTFLPEPAPLAGGSAVADAPDADPAPVADAPVADAADAGVAEPLVAARGPVVVTVLRGSAGADVPADGAPAGAPAEPVPVAAPEEVGIVRAAAEGVVTDVTLSLRFDP